MILLMNDVRYKWVTSPLPPPTTHTHTDTHTHTHLCSPFTMCFFVIIQCETSHSKGYFQPVNMRIYASIHMVLWYSAGSQPYTLVCPLKRFKEHLSASVEGLNKWSIVENRAQSLRPNGLGLWKRQSAGAQLPLSNALNPRLSAPPHRAGIAPQLHTCVPNENNNRGKMVEFP